MYKIIRALLFFIPPEKAHHVTSKLLRITLKIPGAKTVCSRLFITQDARLERNLFGLTFKNPVGLAAGFDKNASLYQDMEYCGFGFIEIGTVTPKAQAGNEQPRLFRLKQDEAILNRMGFNNDGVEAAIQKLKNRKTDLIIGGNIGKNKITPNDQAEQDYIIAFQQLAPYVDYFVVNVSSPNTPNLRALQEKEPLTKLLQKLKFENAKQPKHKPILLKIAPDLTNEQLDDIIDIVRTTKIDGIIATNTTISREHLKTNLKTVEQLGTGGISGKPLATRSTEIIHYIHQKSNASIPIIGVGGIHSAQDAIDKIKAGASLIQLYTGFIYEGPGLIKKINKALLDL